MYVTIELSPPVCARVRARTHPIVEYLYDMAYVGDADLPSLNPRPPYIAACLHAC